MNTRQLYDQYLITSMVDGFQPVEVAKARGCTVTGADGRKFLDCFSGIAVCNAGHCHPKVVAAAKRQLDRFVHCGTYVYYNPRAAECARLMAGITPGRLQKTFFGNSGAEVIEGALRIAKQHTGRKEFVCLSQGFHGRTVATLSITGNRGRKKGGGPYLPGVAFAPAPYCYRCPFRLSYPGCGCACAEHLDYVLKYNTAGDVAAFIAEPVLGEGGILVPPPEYFRIAVRHARKDGALFICDEVQSGFGRTGRMFAIEHYGVKPDILTSAKGIADGFPLAAFTVTPAIARAFTPGDHLSTFGGNPVSCAAAIANIGVLRGEKLPANAAARGEQFLQRLRAFQQKCPLIGDVRGKGLMIGIELVKDAAKTPAAAETKEVQRRCLKRGVLVGIGGSLANVIRIQPPLVITAAEVDRACDVIEAAIPA